MRAEVFPDIAISARNVTLSFGTGDARTDVLKGIDLDIAAERRLRSSARQARASRR